MSSDNISNTLQWYGRRRGHKLRPNRQALIDDLLPKLRIELPHANLLDLDTEVISESEHGLRLILDTEDLVGALETLARVNGLAIQ